MSKCLKSTCNGLSNPGRYQWAHGTRGTAGENLTGYYLVDRWLSMA